MTPEEYINKVKKDRWHAVSGGWLGTFVTEEEAIAAVELAREELMKDALEGKVVAVRNTMSDKLHTYPWIELEAQLSKNDKVKIIIIKE